MLLSTILACVGAILGGASGYVAASWKLRNTPRDPDVDNLIAGVENMIREQRRVKMSHVRSATAPVATPGVGRAEDGAYPAPTAPPFQDRKSAIRARARLMKNGPGHVDPRFGS